MAWPPTINSGTAAPYVLATGTRATTVRWGTEDVVSTTGFYEVKRIHQQRKKEDIELHNGNGVQSGVIQVFHGVTWEITVRDDTGMTPPVEGISLTIADTAGHLGTPGVTYAARVLTSNYDASPKQPGERVLTVERIKLIEG